MSKSISDSDYQELKELLSVVSRRGFTVHLGIDRLLALAQSNDKSVEVSYLEETKHGFPHFFIIDNFSEFKPDSMLMMKTHNGGNKVTRYIRLGESMTVRFESDNLVLVLDGWQLLNRKDL